MGLREGHILYGCALVAFGLWHLFNNIKLFCLRPNTFNSSPWFPTSKTRYLELYLIMSYSSVFMSVELFFGLIKHQPRNFEHSSIGMSLLAYAVLALVLDRAKPRAAASEGLTLLALAAAFTQELLLFHFHSADHMGVEGQYHLAFQLIIFVSLLTTLMGIALPKSFLVSLVRSSSIAFQGAWLILIGFMLYTPSLIPKGCYFQDIEIFFFFCLTWGVAKSLANLEFSWLFVINTIFVVTLYLILDRVYGGNVQCSSLTTSYQSEQYDEERQHFEPHSTQKMCSVQMGKLVDHGDKM
ncbi:uncharacterized protein LOC108821705 [Raphanus sativus]|uniref:Uncharacterized protein LOC108821705 n=1 Tax=Raphanus sativus TaxID=3726 RepID=A0A9W3C8X6_RAPSA|nr:uncharacterized protein LOC108821705 [Raphanus sativus]